MRTVSPRRSKRVVKKASNVAKVTPDEVVSSSRTDATKVRAFRSTKTKLLSPGKLKSTSRPTPEECIYATESLAKLHPEIVDQNSVRRKTLLETCGARDSITDSVVSTMLSQNTTDANAKAAWSSLKEAFPDWESVANCDDISLIEDAIRCAGLAKNRAERIQNIMRTTKRERGKASLEYIRHLSDDQVKAELSRFKGLGPKTISCVLLFALGRDEFPVDTHVLRITQKMGWVSSGATRESAYEYLNDHVPNNVKMDLHCLLVRHGKVCHKCAANGRPQFPPQDGSKLNCPLAKVSSWAGKVPVENLKSSFVKAGLALLKKIKTEDDAAVPDSVTS